MPSSGSGGGTDALVLPPTSALEAGRRLYRRRQTTRSILISLASTAVFAVLMWRVVAGSPGWAVTQQTFFDPDYFVAAIPTVAQGLLVNLEILVFAVIGVAIFAVVLAGLRSLRGPVFFPLRFLAAAYTDLFRGMPFLIVIYLIGFGVPALGLTDQIIPYELLGVVALVLTYSAYVAEVLRAGIEAVHPSQRLAARSLGLNHYGALRLVVLPQAVRKVTPALMNDFVSMQKDVGLVSILGAMDAVRQAQILVAESYNYTPYVVAGLFFVALSWPFIRLTDWVTARQQAREQIGGLV
jgi:polar amino acid transport system permease protein